MPLHDCRLLPDVLQRQAQKRPGRVAVSDGVHSVTYAQLWDRAQRLATWLRREGLRRGDRVLVLLENTVESAAAIYGISLAGGVFAVVHPQIKQDKLRFVLGDCGARFLIAEHGLAGVFRPAIADLPDVTAVLTVDRGGAPAGFAAASEHDFADVLSRTDPEQTPSPGIPVDLASLIYTSGSTGEPKGVMMTHQAMVFTCGSLVQYLRLDDSQRILCALPLAFDYGLYQILMSVRAGATVLLAKDFVFPAPIIKRMKEEQVTVFPGVPTMFATLVDLHRRSGLCFPEVQRVTNTAAALHAEMLPALREIFPEALIYKMYGLTECKRVCYLEPELLSHKPTSVGRAIPGTEVLVLDEEGRPVAPGQMGILHVRGPHVMVGYWNRPEQTAEMLRPGPLPGERMLRSGDWFTQDEEGFLYFQGRSDDIIKSRGEKVSPREVENILYALPEVVEAAVVGAPDALLGEVVCAYVVLRKDSDLSPARIVRHCRERLEPYLVPGRIDVVDALPHTSRGKIDYKKLKEQARGT
jgi:long-chain acyl-CoA synthetase